MGNLRQCGLNIHWVWSVPISWALQMSFQLDETLLSDEQRLNGSPGEEDWQRFGPGDSEAWRMYFSGCLVGNRM